MTMPQLQIYPAAELFPMMTEEELQELAADIQQNGLQVPIVLDHTGKVLIDGRNRLEACRLANVSPRFEKLPEAADPVSVIIGMNLQRRHLSKGQKAVILAFLYPEPEKGGRGKNGDARKAVETTGFSVERLKQARSVLRHSRTMAESVLKGIIPLDDALATVKREEQYQQGDEAKLARLQQAAPDLADQVNEERLKINEAIAALQAREQLMREVSERGRRAATDIAEQFIGKACSIQEAAAQGESITIPCPVWISWQILTSC